MPIATFSINRTPNLTIPLSGTVSDSVASSVVSDNFVRIVDLKVTLGGLTHTFPADLDFLLVGPGGANLEFWSDAVGSLPISNGNFTIADSAALVLPFSGGIASGTYRPADYGAVERSSNWGLAPGLVINHPTLNGAGTLDSAFGGVLLNGTTTWSLYVTDDTSPDSGSLVRWGLDITYNRIQKPDDFNDNGRSDVLWQSSNGTRAIWLMNGMNAVEVGAAGPFNPGPSWQIKANGDFNGDGTSDILWQGADGTPAIWLMDGLTVLSNGPAGPFNPGPSWQIKATGDFNGDGRSDILWQGADGTPAIWLMNGLTVLSNGPAGSFNPGPSWQIKGTGDFNGDGMSDIVWQNTNGQAAIWLMNGVNATAVGAVGPFNPGPSWHVQGTGDYDGDKRSDILWQADDGTPAIWLMNGLNFVAGGAAGSFNPGSEWHVIA
jgi:subtilisin-like proprotein convertase family protein